MRTIVLLLITFLFFSCSSKKVILKSEESFYYCFPKEYEKVYGNVKYIAESNYNAIENSGNLQKGSLTSEVYYKYDKDGNELVIVCLNPDGRLHWQARNFYNNIGKLSQVDYYNDDTALSWRFTYKYDLKNYLVEIDDFSGDELKVKTKTILKNDEEGNLLEMTHYNMKDDLDHNSKYKSNQKDNTIECALYTKNGSLGFKYLIKYDSVGNKIAFCHCDKSDSVVSTSTYQYQNYDKESNWLTLITCDDGKHYSIQNRQIEYY